MLFRKQMKYLAHDSRYDYRKFEDLLDDTPINFHTPFVLDYHQVHLHLHIAYTFVMLSDYITHVDQFAEYESRLCIITGYHHSRTHRCLFFQRCLKVKNCIIHQENPGRFYITLQTAKQLYKQYLHEFANSIHGRIR